jgi:GrpB-like predicted nucleotidyltransferase (UPF0157 family)
LIEVVAYDPSWIDHFDQLKQWYEPMLLGVDIITIEHVGSTSVPGLPAKPIIDLDIVVPREGISRAIETLENQGHVYRGDLGITDRYAFFIAEPPFATNTYLIVEGSVALRNHLLLRQVLRESPELRREYAVVKRQLAASAADIGEYASSKTEVIQRILKYGGMDEESLRLIRDQNT